MASHYVKISEPALKTVSGLLFGTAIAAALLRTVLRLHYNRALALDDGFLLVACIFLTASVILFYLVVGDLYIEEMLVLDPASVNISLDLIVQLSWYQEALYAFLDLSMATVYCVKFSFLVFFRHLVDRLPGMTTYWTATVVVCAISFASAMTSPFIGCPYFGIESAFCLGDVFYTRGLAASIAFSCLDIATDVMIIAIPARLLWHVSIRRRQKLMLGLTLCLSVFMIITCFVQMSDLTATGSRTAPGVSAKSLDTVWQVFWQHVEACIAVAMASFSSSRSLFIAHVRGSRARKIAYWSKSSSGERFLTRKGGSPGETVDKGHSLPALPAAALGPQRSSHAAILLNSSDRVGLPPRRERVPTWSPLV